MATEILIFTILIFLFSVIFHEVAHGEAADLLGDPTARQAGRLTLNPLKHLDPIGSVFLPLMLIALRSGIIFGWAKPVPINPFNLRDKKYGQAKVALAGPAANILIAVSFGLLVRFLPFGNLVFGQNMRIIFAYVCWINLLLALFNLIPIPPLDGSHILFAFLPARFRKFELIFSQYGFIVLLLFLIFFFQFLVPIINSAFTLIVGQPFI